ncbi:DUF1080 domain-containing protein [uncultured Proteiniphilum sp.]|uniref:3-keto-disaccharide hydrolase n=1 Tax=uncultured Proteiniphilum sp. TaxID=497637 RepID=UPI0026082978|nr:DUF1080 domain-containing protein [uncultured Proteiniphilum sp.]
MNKNTTLIWLCFLFVLTASQDSDKGFRPLFENDLSNADYNKKVWSYTDGILTATADEVIWTLNEYENFILDIEFKNDVNTNSGIIIYCPDKANWVPTSIEIQIADDHHEFWQSLPENVRCGSIFGHKGANEQLVVYEPGLWNRAIITAKGQKIDVELNGKHIISANLADWTSATKNPDGTDIPEWLPKPYAELQTKGFIGFQGKHGESSIWFRNVRIKCL